MQSIFSEEIQSLRQTPRVLAAAVKDRPDEWLDSRHRPDRLSPREVLGHLVVGEQIDWVPRIRIILSHGESRPFDPFDVLAGNQMSRERSVGDLVKEFEVLRSANVTAVERLGLTRDDLSKAGTHPGLGRVTLDELMATWVSHDLYHLGQIFKSYAAPFQARVGPWQEFLNLPDFN